MPTDSLRTCPYEDAPASWAPTPGSEPLDWTPLSLHFGSDSPDLCPSPEPDTNWRHAAASQHLSLEWDGMRVRMCF